MPLVTAPTGDGSRTEPSSVSILYVPPYDVMKVWPYLQRAFRKAQGSALGDRMDEMAILEGLCERSKVLLVALTEVVVGGVILEFVRRPKGKACIVVVSLFNEFNGGFPSWAADLNDRVREYAFDVCGCYTIEANVRDGVVPALQQLGWRRKATVMETRP